MLNVPLVIVKVWVVEAVAIVKTGFIVKVFEADEPIFKVRLLKSTLPPALDTVTFPAPAKVVFTLPAVAV